MLPNCPPLRKLRALATSSARHCSPVRLGLRPDISRRGRFERASHNWQVPHAGEEGDREPAIWSVVRTR